MLQSCLGPFPHWNHHAFLKHLKILRFVELQTPFPCVSESVWPLAGVTVPFVPDKFLCPQPSLFAQCQYEFDNVGMPFTFNDLLLYVQDEGSCGFQDPQKLLALRQEPFHIPAWFDSPIGFLSTIRVWWRRDYQVKEVVGVVQQDACAIPGFYDAFDCSHVFADTINHGSIQGFLILTSF